jgi:hypothetical protein
MLKAHVAFLASDSMEGRVCPSRACDLAAEYIFDHFQGVGLTTQFQTTETLVEIRRGDVTGRPTGLTPKIELAVDVAAKVDSEGRILTSRRVLFEKSPDLDPIYNATGEIRVTILPAGLRNVIGVIHGSDPKLKNTYVLVTAHYDHVGMKTEGEGDRIFNGANDNASGVSALIEIARAIRSAAARPKRSIVFIAYFGEEKGMAGSRYYARNPVFPIEQTLAQVNFEQLGRTDDTEGPRVKAATVTGWDRSDVGRILATAAAPSGVRIYRHEKFSEAFFERSDNEALAKKGVPAHTISVAYGFPDYHAAGDEADKLDYANMTTVTRALRAGVVALANRTAKITLHEGSPAASAPGSGSSPASPKPTRSKPLPTPPKH